MCSWLGDWWRLLLSILSRTELGNSPINQILPVGQVGQFRQQLIIKSDNVCWEVLSVYTRPCNAGEPSPKISITAHLGEVSVSLSFSPSFSLSNLKFWWSPDVNGSRQDWDTLSSPLHYLLHLLLLLQLKHGWNVHFISILMHQSSVSSRVVELLTTATPSRGMTDSCWIYFYRDLQPAKVSSCLSDSLVIPGKDDQCWWWWCRCSGWNFPPRVSDYHTSARSASHYLPSLSRSAKLVTIIFESASTMIVVKIVRRGICCQWVDLLG